MNFDTEFMRHPLDLEIYARHARFIEEIAITKPLKSMPKPGRFRKPEHARFGGCPEKTEACIKKTTISAWHPYRTCAMRPHDGGGVVDPVLKVYGTRNIRVVDTSIMPLICRGNTQSTVYAVAEWVSDLIKKDWGLV